MAALTIGIFQLVRPKGTYAHHWIGWAWAILLGYVAISGFFISEIRTFGHFSPIHILSAVTLGILVLGIRTARAGRISMHKRIMIQLFFLALVLTGLFTFLPGRTMYRVWFGA